MLVLFHLYALLLLDLCLPFAPLIHVYHSLLRTGLSRLGVLPIHHVSSQSTSVQYLSQLRQPHISCMYQNTFEYLRGTSPSSIPPQFKLDSSREQDRHLVMHVLRILPPPWPFFGTVFREDDTDSLEGWECSECVVHAGRRERIGKEIVCRHKDPQ